MLIGYKIIGHNSGTHVDTTSNIKAWERKRHEKNLRNEVVDKE